MRQADKMEVMKNHIVESFKKQYGFAPTKKAIIPLESYENSHFIIWLAFWVNGVGYECYWNTDVERNENYDM